MDLARFCLERISVTDSQLMAWAELQPNRVLAEAEELDRLARGGIWLGPLHGIPVGVKDIIDVRGYATSAGYEPWKKAVARQDAEVVARLRAQGALILGKTATCTFASFDPAPTRHPAFPDKTPGGSSAGSAVAVAAGHCPIALGSQTGGSILRPAAYCGVTGFKPTHGLLPVTGVVPLAPSLDHIGFLVSHLQNLPPCLTTMTRSTGSIDEYSNGDQPFCLVFWKDIECRLGPAGQCWTEASLALQKSGFLVRAANAPKELNLWLDAHRKIMAREAYLWHDQVEPLWKVKYPPKISSLLEFGASLSGGDMAEALRWRRSARQAMQEYFAPHEFLCLPAIHEGIPDREGTGDYRYQGLASLIGFPALGVPWPDKDSPAFGKAIQLIGHPNRDLHLISFAEKCIARASILANC
jgi:aspartyl-tRNA(Asn)/glutamyl-tRNA(Gln) amidotransferase subunit A